MEEDPKEELNRNAPFKLKLSNNVLRHLLILTTMNIITINPKNNDIEKKVGY